MEKNITKRQSNFELLRIICMLLIIGHHLAVHGNYPYTENVVINDYIIRLFTIGGKLGVNIFVLISGYFMVDSKFRIKKLLALFAELLFYALSIFLLFLIFGKIEYSRDHLINSLFPISMNAWWFMTTYVILYCLSPGLNVFVKNSNRKLHLSIVLFLLGLQCILPFVFNQSYISNVGWFITLYLLAGYIKMYPNKTFNSNKIMLPISLLYYIFIAVFNMLFNKNLWSLTHFVCLICSVSTFCTFKNFNIPSNKIINTIAKTTFGIYLIHDNYIVRSFLWNKLLNCPLHYQQNTFIIFAVVAVALVFIACMIIDFIRELLFISVNKILRTTVRKIKRKRTEL